MSLTNSQYDAVMRRYDEIRERNRFTERQHFLEISEKLPGVTAIDEEIAALSLRAAKDRIASPSADLAAYRQALSKLSEKKRHMLEEAGYPADYLDPLFDCLRCHDTGFTEDGRHCSCFDRISSELLYGDPALLAHIKSEHFGRFSFSYYSDNILDEVSGKTQRELAEEAVRAAKGMFDGEGIRGSLYIYGNTGVGKTFLTHCIAAEAIARSLSVLYFSAGSFFDHLAESAFVHDGRRDGGRALIDGCDLLVIDDLGTEFDNAFTSSELFRVVNERGMKKLSTVISTNFSLKDLAQAYSERILSRITSDYTIIRLTGEDIRIRKKLSGGRL